MELDIIHKSIECWGLEALEINFITQRENHMYNVVTKNGAYCIRLHRKGLRSQKEIESELRWVDMLGKSGMDVPTAMPSLTNDISQKIDGVIVDVLSWMPGLPMGINGVIADFDDAAGIYYQLGYTLAELHDVSDAWEIPSDFVRPIWNRDGLIGDNPTWGQFWENHCLYFTDKSALLSVKHYANEILEDCKDELDFGLIHADVIPDNVLINEGRANLVNFGDGGLGYRLFDIATLLNRAMACKDYEVNKAAFLKGYRSRRPLDDKHLLLFQALRSFTYLGWIMSRLNEPHGSERCKMFIDQACELAAKFLTTS